MNYKVQLDRLCEELSRSVVTVASVFETPRVKTIYNTGFIVASETEYSLIFTCYVKTEAANEYFVIFKGEEVKVKAYKFLEEDDYIIFIVKTGGHSAVTFSDESVGNELVLTIGAMSGTKFDAEAPVIDSLIGKLWISIGHITTPSCDACDLHHQPVHGAEQYFQVTVSFQDNIILLNEVDDKTHKANTLVGAPVFSLTTGKLVGLIHSIGTWGDTKNGLLSNYIIACIARMCGASSQKQKKRKKSMCGVDDWEVSKAPYQLCK